MADAFQNDFAVRADWCVKFFADANHPPANNLNLAAKPGSNIKLSAKETTDPDGDQLIYQWWYYKDASDFKGKIEIKNPDSRDAVLIIPNSINNDTKLHIVCEVRDNGSPQLIRYKRVAINVKQ
ncbi:hypothetical protein GM418_23495 [Maribellus comscasis]|uniref:Cellulose-binding Sde182 C-terminal domain-containing protein n=1 Tax=Maribellus comscasis TaxID=2681766 RepID=A0A6I6K208_9BACT|nr:hypothetical protein [Maribellus comscasis]QGY46517.1 hypothetical protein GM418_23495 [Maribellus comscasis]